MNPLRGLLNRLHPILHQFWNPASRQGGLYEV